ncbi:MAG: tetratricopeptide repeat protein [Armatimonadetes bacterium]|nr:tetratricopeptide repeat protein [Armatimonadota bacterium]
MDEPKKTPTAFISYSWDDDTHKDWVRELATRLRNDGVETILDQWHSVPGDQVPHFMEQAVADNDFVVIICTPKYKVRADERKGAVAYEGDIITSEILYDENHRKFIPVIASGDKGTSLPIYARGKYFIDLARRPYSEDNYQELLRALHKVRPEIPPVGLSPFAPKPSAVPNKLWMLPNRPTPYFTGQEEVLTEVHTKLATGHVSLGQAAGLVGEGGIGKTEIALQYCQRFADEYERVFWFSGRDRAALQTDLARACERTFGKDDGLEGQPNVGLQRALRMRETLREMSECLVVLDNVDDLEGLRAQDEAAAKELGQDVGFIDALLNLHGPHVLITSRREHWGQLATTIRVEKLPEEEGALMFLRRALNREKASFDSFSKEDRAAALELSRDVDGYQLALDQAGATAFAYQWRPAKYLAEFRARFAELSKEAADGLGLKHEPAYATVELSLKHLDEACPQAGQLVRWCAYLPPDGIPPEIFRVKYGEVVESLQGMSLDNVILAARNQSLIHVDSEHDLLTMHRHLQRIVRLLDSGAEDGEPKRYEALAWAADLADPGQEFEDWQARERLVPVWRFLAERAPESEAVIQCLYIIADHGFQAWGGIGILAEAERAYRLAERLLPESDRWRLLALSVYGSILDAHGRYTEASALHEAAVRLSGENLGERDRNTLTAKGNLARTYSALGRHEEALNLQKEVLELRTEILGPRDPRTLAAMNNLASTYSELGRHEEALKLMEEVLELRTEISGPRHPDTLTAMNNLASTYVELGRHEEALKLMEEVLELRTEISGPRHPETLSAMNNLAWTYWNLGRRDEAIALMRKVIDSSLEVLNPDHPRIKMSQASLAVMLDAVNREPGTGP